MAQQLYCGEPFALELDQPLYAFDSTTIDLCLALFPWAEFRTTKAAPHLVFLTNSFTIPATTVAKIFKQRWQVELFFKSKKKLDIPCPLYTFLQILEVNLFEKNPISSLVADSHKQIQGLQVDNYLKLFSY